MLAFTSSLNKCGIVPSSAIAMLLLLHVIVLPPAPIAGNGISVATVSGILITLSIVILIATVGSFALYPHKHSWLLPTAVNVIVSISVSSIVPSQNTPL